MKRLAILGLFVPLAACSFNLTDPSPVSDVLPPVPVASTGAHEISGTSDIVNIVNIDSSVNDTSSPVTIFLEAGTYEVTPIGIEQGGAWDGWNAWGDTTCMEPTGCLASPTTWGWLNAYVVISPELVAVTIEGRPLTPGSFAPASEQGSGGYFLKGSSNALYRVFAEKVYADARSALSASHHSTFAIANAGVVGFSISDNPLIDNLGGMSLQVTRRSNAAP